MSANPLLHLRSKIFPILAGEEEEVGQDGVFGKSLALYLQAKLQDRGWKTPRVCREDWGWWVQIDGQPFSAGLCIHGIPASDQKLDLYVSVQPEPGRKWSWSRLRFVDTTLRVEQILSEIEIILSKDPAVELLGYCADLPADE